MAWEEGRRLVTANGGGKSLSFTYDSDGLRLTKTVDGTTYSYLYAGGKLMRQTGGGNTLDFFYDESGHPYALTYNGTTYYYVTSLQGDVLHIVNGSGTSVVSYTYDPYGKPLTTTGSLASTLGADNPLRYRGYVYDQETGFYYLQSRYYDPTIGRFINADSYVSTGQGFLGHNMFSYCRSNPASRKDASGTDDVCATDFNQDNNHANDLGNPTGVGGGSTGIAQTSSGGGGGSTGYTYSAPSGGGGSTSSVQVGDTTVTFGHGGRHVDFSDISGLESAMANDVVTRPSTTGTSLSVPFSYGGFDFTYRYFTLSSTHIHIGTYFYAVAK